MKNEGGFTLIELIFGVGGIAVFIIGAIGWIINIIVIARTIDLPLTGLFVLRIAGIFIIPLGSILGIFF